MRFFYTSAIYLYYWVISIASLFNPKAKAWKEGRKGWANRLKKQLKNINNPVIIHCASLGEYEQGRILIEKIKKEDPTRAVVLTFFSPSGYEVRKNDPIADLVTYIPLDTPKQMKLFLEILSPKLVIFVKYEYWYNLMHQLAKRKIPFYYISAIYRPEQPFFKWYGFWFVKHLRKCSHFFVQDQQSKQLLLSLNISQISVTGDTRFDRVYQIAESGALLPYIEQFKSTYRLMVGGSTWPQDEQILYTWFKNYRDNYKLVIAPHEVNSERIEAIATLMNEFKVVRFTKLQETDLENAEVLIIDTIGQLNKIYRYADFAFIGGAFGTGLHNILEAAVFGVPLFFGPKYHKFKEARDLIALQGATSISDTESFLEQFQFLDQDPEEYKKRSRICSAYVTASKGAADQIYQSIFEGSESVS